MWPCFPNCARSSISAPLWLAPRDGNAQPGSGVRKASPPSTPSGFSGSCSGTAHSSKDTACGPPAPGWRRHGPALQYQLVFRSSRDPRSQRRGGLHRRHPTTDAPKLFSRTGPPVNWSVSTNRFLIPSRYIRSWRPRDHERCFCRASPDDLFSPTRPTLRH